jgi:hypothetical protein
VCTYRVPEAPAYDTPQGHLRVHTSPIPPTRDSPALASTRVGGVPDWIVAVGEAAEQAWARETALGFPPPPPDDGDGAERGGDGRYDLYVCDLASHDLGELAATVADPPGSGFSYVVVDNDYAPAEVAPLTTAGAAQLRVTVAHGCSTDQIGEGRRRLPAWLAEPRRSDGASSLDVDREIYRSTRQRRRRTVLEGVCYGAWWLIQPAQRDRAGFKSAACSRWPRRWR